MEPSKTRSGFRRRAKVGDLKLQKTVKVASNQKNNIVILLLGSLAVHGLDTNPSEDNVILFTDLIWMESRVRFDGKGHTNVETKSWYSVYRKD